MSGFNDLVLQWIRANPGPGRHGAPVEVVDVESGDGDCGCACTTEDGDCDRFVVTVTYKTADGYVRRWVQGAAMKSLWDHVVGTAHDGGQAG